MRRGLKTVMGAVVVAIGVMFGMDWSDRSELMKPDAALGTAAITGKPLVSELPAVTGLVFAPGDNNRLFIVEMLGRVRIYDRAAGRLVAEPFLDISDRVRSVGEAGMLSVAFHPQYQTNGRFFVVYNENPGGDLHLAEFAVTGDPEVADPNSEVRLRSITDYVGHNGGAMMFGPDGKLWWSTGDGTLNPQNDAPNNAQNGLSMHGKVLRLDVDNAPTYVAADNPFVGDAGTLDDVWARGLRNPWRMTFDRTTGDLWIADVGKAEREEINFVAPGSGGGQNFGWRCMEATLCTGFGGCTCDAPELTAPIKEVGQSIAPFACAVMGGYVYRGSNLPGLAGRYFYADHCSGFFKSFRYDSGTDTVFDEADHTADLNPLGDDLITTFGEDHEGEMYFAGKRGTVYAIAPLSAGDCDTDGVVDHMQIAGNAALDCNGNGIIDECDITGGFSVDVDASMVPDECEQSSLVDLSSPVLGAVGNGSPRSHTFVDMPTASVAVTGTVTAIADVGADHEFLNVRLNGVLVATLQQDDGLNCPGTASETFTMFVDEFNDALALGGGDGTFEISSSVNVNAAECTGGEVQIDLSYATLDDVDLPCPADCAPIGGNGVVNIDDLLAVINGVSTQDLQCDVAPDNGDGTFGNGVINIDDLLEVVNRFGPCP